MSKLVRDYIPIIAPGNTYFEAKGDELLFFLRKKVVEEAGEVLLAQTHQETAEEIGDLYEVLDALIKELHIDPATIAEIRQKKNKTRGGFAKGLIMRKKK
jgi:predicted house-cleaning noncanonical NTP pyrophosphatase (MazG superfamily)